MASAPQADPPSLPPASRQKARAPWESPGLAAALSPFGALYGWLMRRRRAAYRAGLLPSVALPVPVISVGNLTVGGTGKTPLVAAILEMLPTRLAPALVLSRGYGAIIEDGGVLLNDEGWMLRARHPAAGFAQGANRAAAARRALSGGRWRSVILDDGFQHRRVRRDLDILVIAAPTLLTPDRCIPAGPWREPADTARTADLICLTHIDRCTAAERDAVAARLGVLAPHVPVISAHHRPSGVLGPDGRRRPIAELGGKRVAILSGIGNPDAFEKTVRATGAVVVARFDFPDHHAFTAADLESVRRSLSGSDATGVIVTEKDLKKVLGLDTPERPLGALTIDLDFGADRVVLMRALDRVSAAGRG